MFKQIVRNPLKLKNHLFTITSRCQSSDPDSQTNHTEKSINQVTLLGRVGAEPQKRGSEKHPVVIFSLATNNVYPSGGEMATRTDWHRISVFKPGLRDSVYTYLQKGQRVYVTGRLQYGEVKDESGNVKPITSVIAEDIIFFTPSSN